PADEWIERVAETVFGPDALFIRAAEIAQDFDAIVKKKGKGAACCTRNDASINRSLRRRTAPGRVSVHVIGSTDSPKGFAVVRKLVAKRQTKKPMRLRSLDGIFEIIRVGIALFPEVKPRVRILVRENRIIAGNKFKALIFDRRARPCHPGTRGQRMRRRAHSQEINHHELAKMLPACI